jgi:hypothetical protein
MQRHLAASLIAVDQTGIAGKVVKAGLAAQLRASIGNTCGMAGQGRPFAGLPAVAITMPVADPAQLAAITHRYRHGVSTRRLHLA